MKRFDSISGYKINQAIKELGIKKIDVAEDLGIDPASLAKIINGKHKISRLAKAAFYLYFLYEHNYKFKKK